MRYLILFCLSVPFVVFATECEIDADCGENERCNRMDFATDVPCRIDSDGNQDCPEPTPPPPGECIPGPITCDSDSDCPGISTCVEQPVTQNWQDCPAVPEGEDDSECRPEVIEEESISVCQFVPEPCTGEDVCGDGLVCTEIPSTCIDLTTSVVCPEGEECPEPEPVESACDDQEIESACFPQQIACAVDSECPSDWTCETIPVGGCGGSTPPSAMSAGSAGASSSNDSDGVPEPASGDDEAEEGEASENDGAPRQENEQENGEAQEIEDCPETVSRCMPAGYEHYFFGGASSSYGGDVALGDDDDTANTAQTGAPEGGSSDEEDEADTTPTADSDSGCDCSTGKDSGLNSLWALVLLGAVFRRRLA